VSILVQKFGGSSLSDLARVRAVADKVVRTRNAGHDVVVVVSAMGDSTDELLQMARELAANPSRRELDMLLSVGERISMALLSIAIQERGHEAVSLTGSQCGIITTDTHSDARIMDVRPFRVQDELARGRIVIVAGYQGSSYRREVTTLGRGGSDTTAVALAAALGAEACEIYSDVDGVYSADPRVVFSARQLIELDHDEMIEMARSGAKVLNEQAVKFAQLSKIALYARKTDAPHAAGTIVRVGDFEAQRARAERGQPAVAVTHLEQGLWVRAAASADRVIEALAERECIICTWAPGQGCAIYLGTQNLHDGDALQKELAAMGPDVELRMAGLLSVVGSGIGAKARWMRDGQQALQDADIAPLAADLSLSRLSWVVEADAVPRGANLLHELFIQPD